MKKIIEAPLGFLEGLGVSTVWILLALGAVFIYFTFRVFDLTSSITFQFIFATLPVWLPIVTFLLFYEEWLYYIRRYFDIDAGRVTLEIKLPQEIMKSPEAMELIFSQMYQVASPDNLVQTYWDGKHPPVYGLEIVSRSGNISFYINTPRKKFKNIIEAQLYAQYPGIEVHELDIDYTAEIPWDLNKYFYFSFHYGLKKADAYPIKTYFDFGLHTMPKEEEKNDPLTVMLDNIGSIGPGEYVWVQMLITAHKKQQFKTGTLHTKPDWQEDVKKEIEKIIETAKKRSENDGGVLQLTDGEKNTIQAMERSVSKYAFVTNLRAMYIAEQDAALPGERLGMVAGLWRQYDDVARNQIGIKWRTDTDWPWWQDIGRKHTDIWKKDELIEYKKRTFNRKPHEGNADSIFTTEEMATLFHLPGQVALTPTLGRIPSLRREAPGNLPTG